MRFLALLGKFGRESLREWAILLLALSFAPLFVLIFHFALAGSPTTFRLAVVDEDRGADASAAALASSGTPFIAALRSFDFGDTSLRLEVREAAARSAALALLAADKVDLVLALPPGFSAALASGGRPILEFLGDPASPRYPMLLALAYTAAEAWIGAATGREPVLELRETSIRPAGKLEPFAAMVPSLVILSIMTVIFTAAALFVRESEKGTLLRLRLARVTALEYLGAASVAQLAISISCVFLTLLTAMALGYRLEAPLLSILLTSALAAFSVIAFGLLTAGFCSSVKDVMIVGNFPYLLMLLLSGVMPIPLPVLFTLGGREFGLASLFPLSFGIKALGDLMNLGRPLSSLGFELCAMAFLSLAWFGIGAVLFSKRHLRA